MSYELKKRDVMQSDYAIVATPYGAMQYLLSYQEKVGYTHGVYGWNCDIYNFKDSKGRRITVSDGYCPFSQHTKYDYKVLEKLENKAMKIDIDNSLDYQVKKKKINSLLLKFLDSIEIN